MSNQTKQLIMDLSQFRDQVGLHIEEDNSNALMLDNERGSIYKISQAELEAMKEIMDKKPELKELAHGLYMSCMILINLFKHELC